MSVSKRARARMWLLPDDVLLNVLPFLDPVSLLSFDFTSRVARGLTEHAWRLLCDGYFQATLANPPVMDQTWSPRAKFRYLMQFEGVRRPLWALRASTAELLSEMASLLSNAHLSFWEHWTDDPEYADDICQTLRHLVPISHGLELPASVDLSFGSYVELFIAHVRELAQRGVVADAWMLRPVQVGDIINHLDISEDVRRDFWRVMSVVNGSLLLQPLGVAADAQGRWNSFPRLITRAELAFDYYMSREESAGRGNFSHPEWHTNHRRLSWDFSLMMVYGNGQE